MEYDTSAPHHLMKPSNFPAKLFFGIPNVPRSQDATRCTSFSTWPQRLHVTMLELWIHPSFQVYCGLLWFTNTLLGLPVYPCLPHFLNMCVSYGVSQAQPRYPGGLAALGWIPGAPSKSLESRKDWAVAETTFWSPWGWARGCFGGSPITPTGPFGARWLGALLGVHP